MMRWSERQSSNGNPQGLEDGKQHAWDTDAADTVLSVREAAK